MKFDEAQYNSAVKILAEQIAAMAKADGESDAKEEQKLREEYAVDALGDIQQQLKEIK